MKKILFYFIIILIPIIAIEGFFRLLPVTYPPYILPVNEKNPIARYQENISYTWSRGWDFSITSHKTTNNYGYTNNQDYTTDGKHPLMVIIGDSFVEARQVDNDKTLYGILEQETKGLGRVYSMGVEGAPLSQYLAYAEYAKKQFSPDSMVFIIIGNDFDESLYKYSQTPRFHYFVEHNDHYNTILKNYDVGTVRKLVRHSAFIRYVMLNLRANWILKSLTKTTQTINENQRLTDSKSAVDEFFRQLPEKSGIDKKNILFVIDGNRPGLYSDTGLREAEGGYFDKMRNYFLAKSEQNGYAIKDMQPVFINKNRQDRSTFEFNIDSHWNQLGHKLVAQEISKSSVYSRTFGK